MKLAVWKRMLVCRRGSRCRMYGGDSGGAGGEALWIRVAFSSVTLKRDGE